MRQIVFAAAIGVASLAFASNASAEIFNNQLNVKVGLSGVLPNEDDNAGLNIEITDEAVPTVNLEWYFNDQVSVELLCCLAPHTISAPALGEVGDVTLFPPTITAKYHFNTDGAVQPYVGAGVNFTAFFDEDIALAGFQTMELEESFGGALQAGVDFPLSERASINVDVRRIWISTDATLTPNTGAPLRVDVDIDPWVVGVSYGYRF
jgi:outer membrane protein